KTDVYRYAAEIKFIMVPPSALNETFEVNSEFVSALREYVSELGEDLYLGVLRSYTSGDGKMLYRLSQLSEQLGVPMVAMNDVHYHTPERRELQDVLTCIRE